VDAIACVHLFSSLELGLLSFRSGPFMAHARKFSVKLVGRPGHHMCPQECIDPVQMAARFVSTLQQDIRMCLDPKEVYVLGFGSSRCGAQFNQTPAEAEVVGSYRAFNREVSSRIEQVMRRNLDGIMAGFRIPGVSDLPRYELDVEDGYPVLVNHPGFAKRASEVLKQRFKVDDNADANLGGEDFAYYLEKVPGLFMFLGCGSKARGITAVNHSDRFDMDEACLSIGVDVLKTLALDFLEHHSAYTGS
jgi:amidohydrolase